MKNIISIAEFHEDNYFMGESVEINISNFSVDFLFHVFGMFTNGLYGVYTMDDEGFPSEQHGTFVIDDEYHSLCVSKSIKDDMVKYLNSKAKWFGDGNYLGNGNEPKYSLI